MQRTCTLKDIKQIRPLFTFWLLFSLNYNFLHFLAKLMVFSFSSIELYLIHSTIFNFMLLNIPYVILMCDRVLEWREGYYNGDIKTRKTVQAMELEMKADKIGLQRSEQLKELYKFLLAGEADHPQTKRPSVALAPEDLSDLEWYYLVCMSFVFNHNQRYHIVIYHTLKSHLVNFF